MTAAAKLLGILATGAMFAFSAWMYVRGGDWVAAVFALGSLVWALFFLTREVRR